MSIFFHYNQLFIIKDNMKHILNNLSEEEKKLINTKLGDSKPLVKEETKENNNE